MAKKTGINWFSFKISVLNPIYAIVLITLGILTGILGFILIEGYTASEALYMTIITISTVGFSEVKPLSPDGRLFTSILILFNIGIYAYSISAFTAMVIEGELFRRLYLNRIKKTIKKMKDHIIICGYGRYGREIVENLLHHNIPFIVIDRSAARISEIQNLEDNILFVKGDATHDDILLEAGIKNAGALLTTMSDDADNLFTVLSGRQLNEKVHIISATQSQVTEKKLIKAGANHVIMPNRLGGYYMAMLISKPRAFEFFSFLSNEFESDIGIEELTYEDQPESCRGKSIRDLRIVENAQANIIGLRRRNDSFIVNPPTDTILQPGNSFILLGSRMQLDQLITYLQEI